MKVGKGGTARQLEGQCLVVLVALVVEHSMQALDLLCMVSSYGL
jgi:hypothetical protein